MSNSSKESAEGRLRKLADIKKHFDEWGDLPETLFDDLFAMAEAPAPLPGGVVEALEASLKTQAEACYELRDNSLSLGLHGRWEAKGDAYTHAAELVEAALSTLASEGLGASRDAEPPVSGSSRSPIQREEGRSSGIAVFHELKTWPEYYQAVIDGRKTFEWRLNDRAFHTGDLLVLREWDPVSGTYTGRQAHYSASYVMSEGFGIPQGYAVIALSDDGMSTLVSDEDLPSAEDVRGILADDDHGASSSRPLSLGGEQRSEREKNG